MDKNDILMKFKEETETEQGQQPQTPPVEALGIAWAEVYGLIEDGNGNAQQFRVNLTSRSNTSTTQALDNLMLAVQKAHTDYHLTVYRPSLPRIPAGQKTPARVIEPQQETENTEPQI